MSSGQRLDNDETATKGSGDNLPTNGSPNSGSSGTRSVGKASSSEPLSLTNLGKGGFPATEAAKYLIQAVGRDVVSFRRNTQVSYMVVERARDIVDAINEYIQKVENSDTGDWDSFEKFTQAVEPLEEILFKLLAFTEDEKARYFAGASTIEDCVSSTESWDKNREELLKALEGFDEHVNLVKLFNEPNTASRKKERLEAQTYDDNTLLREIRSTAKDILSRELDRFPQYVNDAEVSLGELQNQIINGSPPNWLTVITVKTSMLLEGVLEIVAAATLGADVLNHLKSKPVWNVAGELITALKAADQTQENLPATIETKYNAFIEILKKLGPLTLPGSYVDLLKQTGHIRRPFQAQAFALVMLCRFLANHFTSTADSVVTVERANALEEAFNETLAALKAAVLAVSTLSREFPVDNMEENETVKAFGRAETLIKASFASFNLSDKWTENQSALSSALNKDVERMKQLNSLLTKPQSSTSKDRKVVTVNISIHEGSPNRAKIGNASVEEESTTRLLALRWSAANVLSPSDVQRARRDGAFYLKGDEGQFTILPLHSKLSEIAAEKTEISLHLVLA